MNKRINSDIKPSLRPSIGVGALVTSDQGILLVKRAKPPSQGLWAIPGGKVKWGETLQEAAEREIFEETDVSIKAGAPVYVFDLIERGSDSIDYHYVVIDLMADYVSGQPKAQDDASEAAWFDINNLDKETVDYNTLQFLKAWRTNQLKVLKPFEL